MHYVSVVAICNNHFLNVRFPFKLREHGPVGHLGEHAQQAVVREKSLVHVDTVPVYHALVVPQKEEAAKVCPNNYYENYHS